MKNIIIFDLDGTLALIDHRRHLVEEKVAFGRWLNLLSDKKLALLDSLKSPTLVKEAFFSETKWKQDWDKFYDLCDKDSPNLPVIAMFDCLIGTRGYQLFIFSGRSESVKGKTCNWLLQHGIVPNQIFMRPEKDFTPDEELKRKWLDEIGGPQRVFCVFDDRDKVVKNVARARHHLLSSGARKFLTTKYNL